MIVNTERGNFHFPARGGRLLNKFHKVWSFFMAFLDWNIYSYENSYLTYHFSLSVALINFYVYSFTSYLSQQL